MENTPILYVDRQIETAMNSLAEKNANNINLIEVKPPEERNEGINAADGLLRSVHFLDMQPNMLLFKENRSSTCGMEIWYDDNVTKFMFYTDSDEMDREYRQQLSGYYPNCDISTITENEGMFIPAGLGKNEAIAVTDIHLKKHYFSPVAAPTDKGEGIDGDPYKDLLNEIDTKDDTRIALQVLYKPAPKSWTEQQSRTLQTYADKIEQRGGYKTKWFGLQVKEVESAGIYASAAAQIRNRAEKLAYYVNLRLAVICSGDSQKRARQKAENRSQSILNAIDHAYSTRAGQTFVPRTYYSFNEEKEARETLRKMILRDTVHMEESSRITEFIRQRVTPNHSKIIMTAEELAGLVHLPSKEDVPSGSIKWSGDGIDGSVPPDVEEYEEIPEEELEPVEGIDLSEYDEDDEQDDSGEDPSTLF